jgi:hypothetical protein
MNRIFVRGEARLGRKHISRRGQWGHSALPFPRAPKVRFSEQTSMV